MAEQQIEVNAGSNFQNAVVALQRARQSESTDTPDVEDGDNANSEDTEEPNPEEEPQPEGKPPKEKEAKAKDKPEEDPISLSGQHYALTRRQQAIERKERELEEKFQSRESEISKREQAIRDSEQRITELGDLDLESFVERFAQVRKVTPQVIYKEFADQLRGVKTRTATDSQAERRIKQLEDRLEEVLNSHKKETEEAKLQRQQAEMAKQVENWTASVLQELKASDAYPNLRRLPSRFVATEAQNVAAEYSRRTGNVPDTAELLEYLEDQALQDQEHAQDAPAKGRKPPKKTLTNSDATDDDSDTDTAAFSPRERELAAIRALKKRRASQKD